MLEPLVTVITPSYNAGAFLTDTIRSVLNQSYHNIHYIVADDYSTDLSRTILANYPYDSRLDIRLNAENMGEQKTVNYLLRETLKDDSKYFMIVNADDPLLPDAIMSLVAFMQVHPLVLCGYPDWVCIDERGLSIFFTKCREWDFKWMVAHHTCIPSVGSIFRTKIIQDIGLRDESFRWLGDFDFWFRIGIAGEMKHLPKTLACWRLRNGQASGDKSDKRAAEHIRIMQKFYHERLPSNPKLYLELIKVQAQAYCWSYLVAAVVSKSKSKTIAYTVKAFELYPQGLLRVDCWDALIKRVMYIMKLNIRGKF